MNDQSVDAPLTTGRRGDEDPPGAWRRNPFVALLVAIPASAVLMAAIMIPLALATDDGITRNERSRDRVTPVPSPSPVPSSP